MNNYKQGKAEKGSELFISDYKLSIEQKNESAEEKKVEQLALL